MSQYRDTEELREDAEYKVRKHLEWMRMRANDMRLRRIGMSKERLESHERYNPWYDWGSGFNCGLFYGEFGSLFHELYRSGLYDELDDRKTSAANEFRFLSAYSREEEHHTHDTGEDNDF